MEQTHFIKMLSWLYSIDAKIYGPYILANHRTYWYNSVKDMADLYEEFKKTLK